jgi:FG-GAP-like repeat/PASTA domain/EF hand
VINLVLADLNGDGRQDLVGNDPNAGIFASLGAGDGTFAPPSSAPADLVAFGLTIADLNKDGFPDTVNSGFGVDIFFGDGRGGFRATARYLEDAQAGEAVAVDLNTDGELDLAVADRDKNELKVLLGHTDGAFASPLLHVSTFAAGQELAAADLNRDGRIDFVMGGSGGRTLTALLNLGDLRFSARRLTLRGSFLEEVALADLNRDGAPDLLAAIGGDTVAVMLGRGNGTFAAEHDYAAGPPVCVVPYLIGSTLAEARQLLALVHCRLGHVGHEYSTSERAGLIIKQFPRSTGLLRAGSKIAVVVSRGRPR